MPIIGRQDFATDRAPDWCRVTGGIVGMGASSRDVEGSVEPHSHDSEEFWFVTNGEARIMTEGDSGKFSSGCQHAIPHAVPRTQGQM